MSRKQPEHKQGKCRPRCRTAEQRFGSVSAHTPARLFLSQQNNDELFTSPLRFQHPAQSFLESSIFCKLFFSLLLKLIKHSMFFPFPLLRLPFFPLAFSMILKCFPLVVGFILLLPSPVLTIQSINLQSSALFLVLKV